jgi:hypothetical protein
MNTLFELAKEKGSIDVISIGINMDCKKVITKSILFYNNGNLYLENGGIKIKCTEEDLDDLFLNTIENKKLLKLKI